MTSGLVITVLIGCLGLATDTGLLQMYRLRTQMAADNAAIAAGLEMRKGTGAEVSAALASARINGFPNTGTTDAVTVSPSSDQVEVQVTQHVKLYFMNVFGKSSSTVSARARARLVTDTSSGGGAGCIYVMESTGSRRMMLGGSSMIRSSCGIFVNSTHSQAMSNDGQGCYAVSNGGINIVGGYDYIWGTGAPAPPNPLPAANATTCSNGIQNNQAPPRPAGGYNNGQNFADPGAHLTPPAVGACTYTNQRVDMSNFGNFQPNGRRHPGTYCGGIVISGQVGTIQMDPGVYIMAGGGFEINGGGSVAGTGVFIYNTSASGYAYKPIVFTSQGSNAMLTAPTSGPYAGLLIYTDRAMTSTNLNQVNGNSQTRLQGTIYMPSVPLIISGSGSTLNQDAAYTAIVAKNLTVNGGGTLNVKSDYSSLPNGTLPLTGGNQPKLLYLGD
ncbi:MAG: hypothetical protein IT162_11185 [Bryobacterales bacterium]|nr:hypothetical protein [Bryobacterales bacterium]